jgi:hypothetical protein
MPHAVHADVPHPPSRFRRKSIAIAALGLLSVAAAQAIEIQTGNPDWTLRWDNTAKYSLMTRLKDQQPGLSTSPLTANQNDGNNNFNKGLVSNRLDWFTELDLQGTNHGARLSAAAWYDQAYNSRTDNTTPTSNHRPASEFPSQTRKVMGRDTELLDAFIYANLELAERPTSIRVGRHTLLWGESLFFGANGIAGGQAPLDVVKLTSVPNTTFKEAARPTGKVSGQVQLTPDVAVGAYVTYDWQPTRLVPVGAYLSTSDVLGEGGERLLTPIGTFAKAPDLEAKDSGQGGLQVRFRVPSLDTDFGLYATRYHATTPSNINTVANGIPNTPSFAPSTYRWLYHEGIRAYGASFAKSVGAWGLAGEVSLRQNAPLASSGQTTLSTIGVNTGLNNNSNPGYAVGETVHAQFSWLASLGPSFLSQEASFVGEVAWNQRRKVTRNEHMLNPNADKSATALRMVFSPSYRQVLPGLDLTPSVGLGYAWGKSSAVGPAFGVDKGGDISLGLAATYLGNWNFGINYVHYLGEAGPTLDATSNAQYKQALKDRNYLTFTVRTTF